MKILMLRFGGIGDTFVLTSVAKCLKDKHKDAEIDLAVRADILPLFENLKVFSHILPLFRRGDCEGAEVLAYTDFGSATVEVVKKHYEIALDFKNSIENNVPSPMDQEVPRQGWWSHSINSNFANWYDLSLSWANIDPTIIPDSDKRPLYFVKEEERREATRLLMGTKPIALHTTGSSLCRRWYARAKLIKELVDSGETVLSWEENVWFLLSKTKNTPLMNVSLRTSAALIEQCELLVSADSGYGHIAEALGIPHITIYSTVPAWTREKYYKYSYPIEAKIDCSPCFTLDRHCYKQAEIAIAGLSARQTKIKKYIEAEPMTPEREVSLIAELNTTKEGLYLEWEGIKTTLNGASQIQAPCLAIITPSMIREKINDVRVRTRGQSAEAIRYTPGLQGDGRG